LLDVPVDYYVKMNFNAFVDVVDALGGIEVDVPYTFSEQNSKDKAGAITLEKGLQTLDGEEALALARTRKKDSDIERGKRQQQILEAIIDKASSAKSITKYAGVIEGVGKNMTTNMTFKEMKSFANYALAASDLQIETINMEGQDSYRGILNNLTVFSLVLNVASISASVLDPFSFLRTLLSSTYVKAQNVLSESYDDSLTNRLWPLRPEQASQLSPPS